MHREHSVICPLCEATCGLKVTTENDKVVTIRGDADDPFSQGYICPKGYALKALEEDPDRLTRPLIKGQPASWEEAFTLIAERLPPLLPDVAVYLGNPNVHNLAGQLYVPVLARVLQGRNLYSASTLDQMPKHVASTLMFGDPMTVPIPDLERTQYLLIMGANPLVSNGSLMTAPNMKKRLKQIQERGGKVVVLDPRRTLTAQHADEHHFLRPGSDAYFLLGILHTLHHENLTQIGPHIQGAEQIARLVQDKTPEEMARHCGIEAETIRRLARELAASPSAAVYGRLGTCTQEFGTLVSWLIEVVNVVTGNLDRPGGAMFPKAAAGAKNTSPKGRAPRPSQVRSRVRGLPQVGGEFPTAALAEEILTPGAGQLRGLITIAGNPALSAPNSDQMQKALEQVEFMVSVDCYLNETTRHADVVLPVPGHLQRAHYDIVFSQFAVHNYARYSAPIFPLAADQLDEWQILLELARILSGQPVTRDQMDSMVAGQLQERYALKDPVRQDLQGPERLLDIMLRGGPYGLDLARLEKGPVDLGPLQPRLPEVLRTASGLVELAPPELVQDLERLQPSVVPEFVLIGRRELRSNNSWMHNLPLLVKGPSVCTMLIHPEDARRLRLQDGDQARVATPEASLEIAVEISDRIMVGVVSIPHGWGHHHTGQQTAAHHAGVNVNRLLGTTRIDPLSGNAVQNGVPVQIFKSCRPTNDAESESPPSLPPRP